MLQIKSYKYLCLFGVIFTLVTGCIVNFLGIYSDFHRYIFNFHEVSILTQNIKYDQGQASQTSRSYENWSSTPHLNETASVVDYVLVKPEVAHTQSAVNASNGEANFPSKGTTARIISKADTTTEGTVYHLTTKSFKESENIKGSSSKPETNMPFANATLYALPDSSKRNIDNSFNTITSPIITTDTFLDEESSNYQKSSFLDGSVQSESNNSALDIAFSSGSLYNQTIKERHDHNMTNREKRKEFDQSRRILSARITKAIKEFKSHKDEWEPLVPKKYITEIKNGYIRAQMMRKRCRLFKQYSKDDGVLNQGKFMRNSFLSSKELKINICTNCKVASSTIREVMYKILNDKGPDDEIRQTVARTFTTDTLFQKQFSAVPSYPNVTFVREPIERLLSAYLDGKGYKDVKRVSFREFLRRILKEGHVVKNKHMQSYTIRCRTCDNRFAFVGLQNTFDADIKLLLNKRKIKYGQYKVGRARNRDTSNKLEQYFKRIPNHLIHLLWEQYYIDYFLYGFPYPSHLMH